MLKLKNSFLVFVSCIFCSCQLPPKTECSNLRYDLQFTGAISDTAACGLRIDLSGCKCQVALYLKDSLLTKLKHNKHLYLAEGEYIVRLKNMQSIHPIKLTGSGYVYALRLWCD